MASVILCLRFTFGVMYFVDFSKCAYLHLKKPERAFDVLGMFGGWSVSGGVASCSDSEYLMTHF
jgi:hypothetical protein